MKNFMSEYHADSRKTLKVMEEDTKDSRKLKSFKLNNEKFKTQKQNPGGK